jgi:uncharacterized protein (TIGR02099 family)
MHTPPPPRSHRLAGAIVAGLGVLLILACAAYLTVRHAIWPQLDAWRHDLIARLEQDLQRPVRVGALRPGWDGLHPTLELQALRLEGPDGEPRLEVDSAYLRVSWRSLLLGELRLAALRADGARLVVERLAPDRWAVAGFEVASGPPRTDRLDWLLRQGELVVSGGAVRVVDRTAVVPERRLEGIDAALISTGRHHRARLAVARAADLSGPMRAAIELDRARYSRASDPSQWRGQAHVAAEGIVIERVVAFAAVLGLPLPGPARELAGRVDALAWLRFGDGRLDEVSLKLRGDALALDLSEGRLALREAAAEVRATPRADGGHAVVVSGLSATDASGFAIAADGRVELELDASLAPQAGWLRLASFDARAALEAVRRLPLPSGARQSLDRVEVAGVVRDLTLRWTDPAVPPAETRPADRSADVTRVRQAGPRVEATAAFEGLTLLVRGDGGAWPQIPSFRNLSGALRASERDGSVNVASRDATLIFPNLFVDPDLPFERLDAQLRWSVDRGRGDAWLQVDVDRLAFVNADGRGEASGGWRTGGQWIGHLELEGRVERIDARRLPRYLPVLLPAHVRDWVERSLLSGTIDEVRFETRGDLWNFPFRVPEHGIFRIAGRVRDGTLAYAPGWPRIDQIRGDVTFERASLSVRAPSGQVGRVRLSDVDARLPDYNDAVLTIEGRGAGAAQDLLRFIDDSPLAATVATFTRDIRAAGDAKLAMRLTLPLSHLEDTRVAGSVELAGNDIELDRTLPPFSAVSGRLEFTEAGLSLPEVRATFLGGPLRVEGRPAGDGRMHIEAAGSIDADGMRTVVDNPLTRRLSGRTDYRARIEVDRRSSTVRIESDLIGLASALPPPFFKAAAEPWPLRVQSTPLPPRAAGARPPGDRLDVRVGDAIALALERERDPGSERMRVARAGFATDGEPVLRDSGLSVLLRTERIDVDAWMAVLGDGELERLQRHAEGTAGGMSLVPDLVSVVADDVRVGGRDLHEVVFGATRLQGRWRANVAAREVQGHFDWHDARPGERIGTLVARFDRLVLARSREREVEAVLAASPAQLPGLDLTAEQLVLGDVVVGRLTLAATNGGTAAQPVWSLDRLVLTHPNARLEASGRWAIQGAAGPGPEGRRGTELVIGLDVQDAGRLLGQFGLREAVRGGSGRIEGRIDWRGTPIAIDYPSLGGQLKLAIGQGEFLKVDPGLAKLIGVLNMQSLPKRLAGDFRDLFAEGFVFDSIEGDVRIDQGIARTDELRIRGLQAQVKVRGEADIERETQRLRVEVVPELNAGIASIAFGAMVNPAIGLGSLAAQYVLRKPLQEALTYEVDVTGSWSDPAVVERPRRSAVPSVAPSHVN